MSTPPNLDPEETRAAADIGLRIAHQFRQREQLGPWPVTLGEERLAGILAIAFLLGRESLRAGIVPDLPDLPDPVCSCADPLQARRSDITPPWCVRCGHNLREVTP